MKYSGLVLFLIASCVACQPYQTTQISTATSPAISLPSTTETSVPSVTPSATESFIYGTHLLPQSGLIYNLESESTSYQRLWQVTKDKNTIVTVYNGRDLRLSPNLLYGAYLSNGDIWLLELNTGTQSNITNTPECSENSDYEWSPDSTKLLYFGCFSDEKMDDLYTIELSTRQIHNLTSTTDRHENLFIKWWGTQPNTIFFGSGIPEKTILGAPLSGQCHTFLGKCLYFLSSIQTNGTSYTIIDNVSGIQFQPALSPDGKTLAYDGGILYDIETGIFQINNPSDFGISPSVIVNDDGLELVHPVWSPSGKQIIWLGHTANETYSQTAIYLFDLTSRTGKILHRYDPYYYSLTLPPWQRWSDIEVSWSPDEQYFAVISDEFLQNRGSLILRVFDNKGNVIQKYEGSFNNLVWSPNSKFLTFGYFELESQNLITLILNVENWQLNALDIPANSKVIKWVATQ